MLNFIILIPFFFLFYLYYALGSVINNSVKLIHKKEIIDIIFLGFSIFIIFSYITYFLLNFGKFINLGIIICFLIYYNLFKFKLLKISIQKLYEYTILSLTLIIFLIIPASIYGEQFYVFRGNYWDSFNYLNSAYLFNSYSYFDLNTKNIINKFSNFQSIGDIINYRPYINYLLSIFLHLKILDIFYVNYTFKIFLVVLNFLSFLSFLNIFNFLSYPKKIILSYILSLSFFSYYVFEIDALSHLASISLFLMSIKYMNNLFVFESVKLSRNSLSLSILNSALFIIYPEIFLFYIVILLSFIVDKVFLKKKKLLVKNFATYFIFFLLFTLPSFKTNYIFLFSQITHALHSINNWWGYFGAFIFGKENLVLDTNYINSLFNYKDQNIFQLLKKFYLDHLNQGYNFVIINIIPSFFGLYYLTIGKLNSFSSYLILILSIILNFYILIILKNNLQYLLKRKFIFISFIFVILITLVLLFRSNFWTIIKIYSYSLIFLYISLIINFKSKSLNGFIAILLIIFPFYKFSSFNYGIGKLDSFPSIIKKNYKTEIKWNLNKKKLKKCSVIYTNENDYFIKNYIILKSLFNNIKFIAQDDLKSSKIQNICKVSIIKNNFVVTNT